MQLEEGHVVCIMRRYHRRWGSHHMKGFFLSGTRPEERRFELLDEKLSQKGEVTFEEYSPGVRAEATTPWGTITTTHVGGYVKNGKRGSLDISLDKKVIAVLEPHILRWDFKFPDKAPMTFKIRPGRYVLRFDGETGSAGVSVNEGAVEDTGRTTSHIPTRKELRALPKEKRPNSVAQNDYTQWTITVSGILPIDEQDVVISLIMEESLSALDFENYGG